MIIGKKSSMVRIKKQFTKPGFKSSTADNFDIIVNIVNPIEEGLSIMIWVKDRKRQKLKKFLTQPIERIKKLPTGKFSVETPTSYYEIEEIND